MLKLIAGPLAAVAALAMFLAVPSPAQASERYPWCAVYSERSVGATNCGFVSLAQCRATVMGIGGSCQRNPTYREPASRKQQRQRY
jgi:hypothetical protein